VTLIVSNAVRMPNVIGQSVGDARAKLQALGLQVQVRQLTLSDGSVVISQSVGAQGNVESGTTITIVALP
jgi:serine/threonine-protein kinase